MLDYKIHVENDSMYNTPPCWSIYMCGLVFDKLLKMGGLDAMQKVGQTVAPNYHDYHDIIMRFHWIGAVLACAGHLFKMARTPCRRWVHAGSTALCLTPGMPVKRGMRVVLS
jgi:hypothetical protein